MAQALGGEVAPDGTREYGRTELTVVPRPRRPARRAAGPAPGVDEPRRLGGARARRVHRDRLLGAGRGGRVRGPGAPAGRRAVPPRGRALAARAGGAAPVPARHRRDPARAGPRRRSSTRPSTAVRAQVGDGRAICGLSGGVDSAVAAALVQRAIGDQLTCVFVDHGLLRAGERQQVERDFVAATGVDLHTVDAADRFLAALAGVTDPEQKRKIIGREFIRVFEAATARGGARRARRVPGAGHALPGRGGVRRRHPAPRTSRATTTSAGCRTTSSSRWSSRCARCSRTRCAGSGPSSGCPRRSSGGSRSPGPGWASASSAR